MGLPTVSASISDVKLLKVTTGYGHNLKTATTKQILSTSPRKCKEREGMEF
jgi:hypothetical protein